MRKLILMMLLSLVSNSVMAEWIPVAKIHSRESPELQIGYVDPGTIHKNGSLVKMVVLVDHQSGLSKGSESRLDAFFPSSKGKITKSWKVQDEFNCTDKKLRMLSYTGYDEHMGNGAIVPNTLVTGEWEPVIPGSIGQALWEYACGKQ
jgi:hypothetical protein